MPLGLAESAMSVLRISVDKDHRQSFQVALLVSVVVSSVPQAGTCKCIPSSFKVGICRRPFSSLNSTDR